jgi:tetratricopeptide (TPR) repeat protein
MKKLVIFLMALVAGTVIIAQEQELPNDVEKVFKGAERLKSKGEYNKALSAYNEVLRSVEHVESLVSCGNIEMELKAKPNYREAFGYYDRAIKEIEHQINIADKRKDKGRWAQLREELVPKRKKAQSYVDQFDDAKEQRERGNRLLEDPDLD